MLNLDGILNNTVIINDLIYDLCMNSTPEKGLCFSDRMFKMINSLKDFNYRNIYSSRKLGASHEYFKIVLNLIYDTLKKAYQDKNSIKKICPDLLFDFEKWLKDYGNLDRNSKNKNKVIFDLQNEKDYYKSIICYISGMTDNYAINMYNKIIGF